MIAVLKWDSEYQRQNWGLFFFHLQTFSKHIRKYLFHLKNGKLDFQNSLFRSLAGAASLNKGAALLGGTRTWQHLFPKMSLHVDKSACSQTSDATGSPAAPAKCSQVLV